MTVPDSFNAKEKAKEKLRLLESTQKTILNEIVLREGTIKQKVNDLAYIIEQRIELLDPELEGIATDQISTLITRMLREKGCTATANHVNEYLPPKFRNKNLARVHETIDKINEIGTVLGCHLPEDCSSSELQDYVDRQRELKNEYDKALTAVNKNVEKAEFIAFQKGFQLDGEKYRRQISEKDFDEPVPANIQEYVEPVLQHFTDIAKGFLDIRDNYARAPPRELDEIMVHDKVLSTFKIALQPHKDSKFTGDLMHAFERQYRSDMNGKHAAGNSDRFPTKLCKNCSVINENDLDPDDYEIMRYDTTSETNYRCMKCTGTESITRGMSRENVGDTQAITMRKAQMVIEYLPLFGQCLSQWNRKYIQIKEDSRKEVISRFFGESAIQGTGYKIARQVSTSDNPRV